MELTSVSPKGLTSIANTNSFAQAVPLKKVMFSLKLEDIKHNLRVYMVGEFDEWKRHSKLDTPKRWCEAFGMDLEDYDPEDYTYGPFYVLTPQNDGDGFYINYYVDQIEYRLDEIHGVLFNKQEVVDFFKNKVEAFYGFCP